MSIELNDETSDTVSQDVNQTVDTTTDNTPELDDAKVNQAIYNPEQDGKEEDIEHPEQDSNTVFEASRRKLESIKNDLASTLPSQEAFGIFTPGSEWMTKLGNYLNDFSNSVKETSSKLLEKVTDLKFSKNSDYTRLSNYASRTTYFAIHKQVRVYQPLRLGVDWLTYSELLNNCAAVASQVDKDVLAPFAEYLARAINKPDLLTSISFKPNYKLSDLDGLRKSIKDAFQGPGVEKVYWGQAFKRNEDVPLFITKFSQVKKTMESLTVETLNKSVNVLADRAAIIAKGVSDENGKFAINKNSAEHLSDLLHITAQYVEFYTVVVQLIYELDQCIQASESKLKA